MEVKIKMKNSKNDSQIVAFLSTMSFVSGYNALEQLLTHVNIKASILQAQLANASNLTKEVYESAISLAEKVPAEHYVKGVCAAVASGLCAGVALYYATRKNK